MKNLIDSSGNTAINSCNGMVDYTFLKNKNFLLFPTKIRRRASNLYEADKYNIYDEITPHPSQTNTHLVTTILVK